MIDFDGLAGRVEALPLERGNYRELAAGEQALFYLDAAEGDFNRMELRDPPVRDLHAYSFADREEHVVIKGIDAYRLAAGGERVVYRRGEEVGLLEAGARDSKGAALTLDDLTMRLEPLEEWRQVFNEAWRLERDYYYEPGMNGVDWPAMRERYGRLLESASCRQDVSYLIGELIGELSTSHTYVAGGDNPRKAAKVSVGMLGADWQADPASHRYRLKKIYRVPDWTDGVVPPLAGPGVDAREGDVLLAVDGQEVTTAREVYAAFAGLAGKQVMLTLAASPAPAGAREVTVKPLASEADLRYHDWVEGNRRRVEQASDGRLGYLHLPDTFTGSAAEFPKYFLAQTQKQGLVVDGRFNAGGLDPDVFLQRLANRPIAYWTRRHSHDETTPLVSTRARLVCLTNHQAGSGGDMLPWEFRLRGMGPIVGTRTWGGLVGVSSFIPLIDSGTVTAPDYRIYDTQGHWVVENVGVVPDVVVELDAAAMMRGRDSQLERAIEILLASLESDPLPEVKHEAFPGGR